MVKKILITISLVPLLIISSFCDNPVSGSGSEPKIKFEKVLSGLASPVALAHSGDDRLFIAEQTGVIRIIKNGNLVDEPFLDITNEVEHGKGYSEKGLLGLVFHPDYKNNGRFFVYYSTHYVADGYDHKSVISEFKVSPQNPDKALSNERVILEILEPEQNHNGGQLAFGPDGNLYVGVGDGGGAGDKHGQYGNGQDLSTVLGKILRLDVNGKLRYTVPADNPFLKTPNARGEIFAYGLRNPWRFSFDRKTHELFCGDVGKNEYEEIDIIKKGGNYGWRAMEGKHVYDKSINASDMIDPIHEYPHKQGICVIGGYVYRGSKYPALDGKYFYADWTGKVFCLEKGSDNKWINKNVGKEKFLINSFGEDINGELYILGQDEQGVESKSGVLYQLVLEQ